MGPADTKEIIEVSIYVRRPPNAPPLHDLKYYAARPLEPKEHISREELAKRHGATAADLKAVTDFAATHGLKVIETSAPRRLVRVTGTAAQLAGAFSVELFHYQSKTERYRGHEGSIHLPAEIADIVTGVFGLDNRRMARRANGGTGAGNLTPPQVAQAYNFPSGSAAGETVAVLEFSGPISQSLPTCGFAQSDIDGYINYLNSTTGSSLHSTTVKVVNVDHSTDTPGDVPGGSASNFDIDNDADVEVALDLEVIVSVAQGASVVAYFAPSTEKGWADAISAIVADTTNNPSVLSISWGWAELESDAYIDSGQTVPWMFEWTQAAFNQLTAAFQDAANIGMTVFASSGDQGSDCQEDDGQAHVIYPSTDPWVTAVGGTIINTLSPLTEGTWNDNSLGGGATGGGISYLAGKPSWQNLAKVPVSANPDHHVGRGVPDVAGNASPNSGYILWLYGTSSDKLLITAPPQDAGFPLGPVGGTSAVGPLYASLIAIVNANLKTNVGYLNPTLYELGSTSVFRDINDGVTNSVTTYSGPTSPGYTSGPGWDACTGWGSIDGNALLSLLRGVFQKTMTFVMQRDTFGQDEVAATGGTFSQAFFITVSGLRPSDFPGGGITTLSPTTAQLKKWAPTLPDPVGSNGPTNITITPTAVSSDDPSLSPAVQLFTFTYQVTFPDQSAFNFPASDFPELLPINATLAATTGTLKASQQIELIQAADPFFSSESNGQPYYLSEDLRVFYAEEGSTKFGAPALGGTPAGAISFIQWIVSHLSGPDGKGPNGETFESLGTTEDSSQLSLFPTTLSFPPKMVYNFALARVRLNGTTAAEEAKTVRAFFRLFQSQSVAMVYDTPTASTGASPTTGAYRQWSDGATDGQKIPLLGISSDGTEYITVPCFAAARVANANTSTNMWTQKDPTNVQSIVPVSGQTTYAYFGCWLDNNQSQTVFPYAPGANPDGPFTGQTLNTVSQVIDRGGHQCLMVEIVDDEAPIINDAVPWSSDKIAQRNLAFTAVANPGVTDSRLATHTFELRPSPTKLNADQRPDELMIEWGNVPEGSVASIYLPAVAAADVLRMAAEMYATHNLSATDAHTLECKTGGTTYIPIPHGLGPNYAGLFSIQLPLGVKRGQEFRIAVRQITSVFSTKRETFRPRISGQSARARLSVAEPGSSRRERYVYGAFQFSIPVSTKSEMLVPEERFLSVMKWIRQSIPASSRWYPVFQRYVHQLTGRVTALGGNGNAVPPTQTGIWPGLLGPGTGGGTGPGTGKGTGHEPSCHGSCTGKVDSIVYDHFGDFEAFVLETLEGEHHRFDSHEAPVLRLVQQAWAHRILTTVRVHHDHPERPFEIILHGAPPPFEE